MKQKYTIIKNILRLIWKCCCWLGGCVLVIILPVLVVWAVALLFVEKEERACYCNDHRYLGEKYVAHIDLDGPCYFTDKETGETVLNDAALVSRDPTIKDCLAVYRVCNNETRNSKSKGLRGYFNSNTGKVQIEPQFQHAWYFSNGVAAVCQNDSVFFIDTQGNPINPKRFPYVEGYDYVYKEGFCCIPMNGKYGVIDLRGEWILAPTYDQIKIDGNQIYLMFQGTQLQCLPHSFCQKEAPLDLQFNEQGDTLFNRAQPLVYVRQKR